MDFIRTGPRFAAILLPLLILTPLSGPAHGQTMWKDYIKGPGVTYTAGSTVSAKMADPAACQAAAAPLNEAEGCGRQLRRLLLWNELIGGEPGAAAAAPGAAIRFTGAFSTTLEEAAWSGEVQVDLAADECVRAAIRRGAGTASETVSLAELPSPARGGRKAYQWQVQATEAAKAYGGGRPVYAIWADGDRSRWWLLTLDSDSGRIGRIQAMAEPEDGQVVDLGTLEVEGYEYQGGRWCPARLRELIPGGSSTTMVFERIESPASEIPAGKDIGHD